MSETHSINLTIEIPANLQPSDALIDQAKAAASSVFDELVALQGLAEQLKNQGIEITAEELLARKSGDAGSVNLLMGRGKKRASGSRTRLTDEQKGEIVEKLKAGSTLNDIANAYGCSTATVMKIKKDAGLAKTRES
ncbi:MAG: hypothetical protein ACFE0O_04675 [Opitutales bacterium]